MFNYTREIIINKPINEIKRVNGSKVILERVGEYDTTKILKIYHTAGTEGVAGTFTINCSTLAGAASSSKAVYNVQLFVKTVDKYLVDYANANWGAFGKAVVVEFEAGNTASAVADALKKALEEAVKDLDPMFTLTKTSDNNIKGTFVEKYFAIGDDNIVINVYNDKNELEEVTGAADTTETTVPFGTYAWLVENLRFPSYPNVRYAAKNSDEYPMAGKLYDMVSFQYAVERPGLGGLSAVGQKVESVTTHVMYVPQDQAAALIAALRNDTAYNTVADAAAANNKPAVDTDGNGTDDVEDYGAETH